MFVDAAAIIAVLSDEDEAERCSAAIAEASEPFTSAIAVWEAAVALARPDKLGIPIETSGRIVTRFIEERGIAVRELPDAVRAIALSLGAAGNFRSGARKLNLADCFHYACASHYKVPILSTADEFRFTDIDTVP
jgi:ribonuclease VapC